MTDLVALKALIDAEPANAGRTDPEVRAWLKELVSSWQDISWLEFQVWRHQQGVTDALLDSVITGGGSDARKTAAKFFLDVTVAGVDFASSDSRVRQLILDAQLPAAMQSSLQAAATIQERRDVANGLGLTSLSDVIEARAL